MRYLPEPESRQGTVAGPAILLINLGTPDSPTPNAVRRYLREFLSDPRVIEIPRAEERRSGPETISSPNSALVGLLEAKAGRLQGLARTLGRPLLRSLLQTARPQASARHTRDRECASGLDR